MKNKGNDDESEPMRSAELFHTDKKKEGMVGAAQRLFEYRSAKCCEDMKKYI